MASGKSRSRCASVSAISAPQLKSGNTANLLHEKKKGGGGNAAEKSPPGFYFPRESHIPQLLRCFDSSPIFPNNLPPPDLGHEASRRGSSRPRSQGFPGASPSVGMVSSSSSSLARALALVLPYQGWDKINTCSDKRNLRPLPCS